MDYLPDRVLAFYVEEWSEAERDARRGASDANRRAVRGHWVKNGDGGGAESGIGRQVPDDDGRPSGQNRFGGDNSSDAGGRVGGDDGRAGREDGRAGGDNASTCNDGGGAADDRR